MKKEIAGYFLIAVSFISLVTHISDLFHSFSYGYYRHANTILFIVQVSLFFGIKLLPAQNPLKIICRIIFSILCFVFLILSLVYYETLGILFFLQSLFAALFAYFLISTDTSINSKIAFILRIFAVFLFIGAVVFRFQDFSHNSSHLTPFLIVLAIVLFLIGIAQILNPISILSNIKLYGSLIAYYMIIMIWAKDISYTESFIFHENKLTYSHALFNNSFTKLFRKETDSEVTDNKIRKQYAASEFMSKKCDLYTYYKEKNDHSDYLEKLIIEAVKSDFDYYKLYKEKTGLTEIDIDKIIQNKDFIFIKEIHYCETC